MKQNHVKKVVWLSLATGLCLLLGCGVALGFWWGKETSRANTEFVLAAEIQFRSWFVLSAYKEQRMEEIAPLLDYDMDRFSEKVAFALQSPDGRSIENEPYLNCLARIRAFHEKHGRLHSELPTERLDTIDATIDETIKELLRDGGLTAQGTSPLK